MKTSEVLEKWENPIDDLTKLGTIDQIYQILLTTTFIMHHNRR